MYSLLYKNQTGWAESRDAKKIFLGYATTLGLDIKSFEADLTSKEVALAIENDFQSGDASGINGTPTFFLNGVKIQPRSYDEFKTAITSALGKE